MRLPQDLDILFGTLINKGIEHWERGANYLKFEHNDGTYVVEWIGDNLLLWKSTMLFRGGCKTYPFDTKTMDGGEVGEEIWNDLAKEN